MRHGAAGSREGTAASPGWTASKERAARLSPPRGTPHRSSCRRTEDGSWTEISRGARGPCRNDPRPPPPCAAPHRRQGRSSMRALHLDAGCGASPHTRVEEPEKTITNSHLTGAPATDKCLPRAGLIGASQHHSPSSGGTFLIHAPLSSTVHLRIEAKPALPRRATPPRADRSGRWPTDRRSPICAAGAHRHAEPGVRARSSPTHARPVGRSPPRTRPATPGQSRPVRIAAARTPTPQPGPARRGESGAPRPRNPSAAARVAPAAPTASAGVTQRACSTASSSHHRLARFGHLDPNRL